MPPTQQNRSHRSARGTSDLTRLHVRAGGRRVAVPFSLVREFCEIGPRVAVPGAKLWCLGLVQWRGRLLTLLDAGRLCGGQPSEPQHQIVLSHPDVETALAVDDYVDLCNEDVPCDVLLDERMFAELGSLTPGSASNDAQCLEAVR